MLLYFFRVLPSSRIIEKKIPLCRKKHTQRIGQLNIVNDTDCFVFNGNHFSSSIFLSKNLYKGILQRWCYRYRAGNFHIGQETHINQIFMQ